MAKLSPHGPRLTCATLPLKAGVHPLLAKERLGYRHVSMTPDTCSHVTPTLRAQVADVMERLRGPDRDTVVTLSS